jgi:hypothetical protein
LRCNKLYGRGVGAFFLFLLFSTTNYQPATPRARGRNPGSATIGKRNETAKILAVSSLFPLFFAVLSILKSLEGDTLPRSAQMGVQDR